MRILLLGAHGMLGHALAATFAAEDVTALDRDELDITDKAAVTAAIHAARPDVVINAAAYTAVDKAEEEREQAFAANAEAVNHIAEAAKAVGATMVHYSTDYVFSGEKEAGYLEDDTVGPAVNAYGASKLAGEQALLRVAPTYYLIRTAWLYGAHGKNFVDTMLQVGTTRRELRVINDQHGSPTYAHDVAQATQELLRTQPPGVYHTVNDGVATWYDLAQAVFAAAKMKVTVQPIATSEYPLPARRPQYSILRRSRGPTLRPWQAALDEYIKSK